MGEAASARVRLKHAAPVAAALVAVAVMLPSLRHGYVYDDVWIVAEREIVRAPGGIGSLLAAPYWPEDYGGVMWRPGALVAFAAQWAAADGNPVVFHAVNVALYGMLSALVALLGAALFSPVVGLVAGLLFAAHPVHVEAAANVVGQVELLPAVCYVGVLLVAWQHLQRGGAPRRWGSVAAVFVLTALGLSVKEHVVTLPAALLVLWWLQGSREGGRFRGAAGRGWPLLVAVLIPVVLYLPAQAAVTGSMLESGGVAGGLSPDSGWQRLVVMLPVSLHWLRLLFVPAALSADYSPAHVVPQDTFGLTHLAALTVWAAVGAVAWRARHRLPAVAAGVGLFAVTISVVSNVVVPLEILLAERLLLLPSVGWAVAVSGLAAAWMRLGGPHRTAGIAAVAVAVALLAARAAARVPMWANNEVFFAQMLRDAPLSYRNARRAAQDALARRDSAAGERLLVEAARLNPEHPGLQEQLGLLYLAAGRHDEAIPRFATALLRDPDRPNSLFGLAVALTKTGRGEEALVWLERLETRVGPSRAITLTRIEALRAAGRQGASVAAAEAALRDNPDDWYLHLMAAESAVLGGRCDAALEHVRAGLPKTPEDRQADFERVRAHVAKGEAGCK